MQEDRNTNVVREIYAAFEGRDIAALLAHLDPQVSWKAVTGASPHVPTGGAVNAAFEPVAASVA